MICLVSGIDNNILFRVNVPPSIALDKNKSLLCHYAIRALSAIHGTSISCVELMCHAPLRSSMMINICPCMCTVKTCICTSFPRLTFPLTALDVILVAYSECISLPPLRTCVPDSIRAVRPTLVLT